MFFTHTGCATGVEVQSLGKICYLVYIQDSLTPNPLPLSILYGLSKFTYSYAIK